MTASLPAELRVLPDLRGDPEVGRELAALGPLEAQLGRRFVRPALLRVALTLRSWCNEHPAAGWPSNECLEFFGDAVLDLVSAERVWMRWSGEGEGSLTRLQASVVSEPALAAAARAIDLGAWIWVGRGDERGGVRGRDTPLADALEAVLGAIFLDARAAGEDPLAAALAAFDRLLGGAFTALRPEETIDAVSQLVRWAERKFRRSPRYVCELAAGASAERPWWRARVEIEVGQAVRVLGEGEGASKRDAKKAAAQDGLARQQGPSAG